MEVIENTDTTVDNKIKSVNIVKKCIVEPVQKMFANTSSSKDYSFRRITEVYLYLEQSKQQFNSLNEALLSNRCANSDIEIEVKQVIDDLKKNIILLEEKMKLYKQSVEEKNKGIEISSIEKYFQDPNLFKAIVDKITLVYEDPSYDTNYGDKIRRILTDLGKSQSSMNSKELEWHITRCETTLEEIEKHAICLNKFNNFQVQKNDVINVQKSFECLIEICKILMPNIE